MERFREQETKFSSRGTRLMITRTNLISANPKPKKLIKIQLKMSCQLSQLNLLSQLSLLSRLSQLNHLCLLDAPLRTVTLLEEWPPPLATGTAVVVPADVHLVLIGTRFTAKLTPCSELLLIISMGPLSTELPPSLRN